MRGQLAIIEETPRDGWSPSAWKSLLVKSLRIGWPNGCRYAEQHLPGPTVRSVAVCQIFEDIFPSPECLSEVAEAVLASDWEALCRYDTHHGRGMTPLFCELGPEAMRRVKESRWVVLGEARARLKKEFGVDLPLPPRSANVVWTWLQAVDRGEMVEDRERPVCRLPEGMPESVLDMHTPEGRGRHTWLSGTYSGHRRLAELVAAEGWEGVHGRIARELEAVE